MVLKLVLFAVLLLFSAFFVATEFAVVRLRASRVTQMVKEGVRNAKAVEKVVTHLDGYLSACQLGITITALGLGWLGEPTVHQLLHPLFDRLQLQANVSSALSFIISFVIVTYLHVVLGELAPKTLAIIKSEEVSQFTSPIIVWFHKIMYPFIWLLNGSANGLIRMLGFKPTGEHEAHSEEEIRHIMSESYESGKINKSELSYVNRIFEFDERLAREIMVPRTDMICVDVEKSRVENIAMIRREQYTRFPVIKGSKDNVIGVINTKYFFMHDYAHKETTVENFMQPIMSVPEVLPIKSLLRRMQQERVHIAILLDEYGGTSGLITIEDIIEEIVGEIRDEFDADETKEIEQIGEKRYLVDGIALLSDVNQATGSDLQSQDVDSIGGWLFNQNPDLQEGDTWTYAELTFTIRKKEKHRIRKVEIVVK
ncbi:hemolysin family protein [Paenibacillus sp. NPDC058071]|uniref:hemolysin family protein n=1 Tax=Paenibacillus sp. NPDC058071 TaxID=3346326 RepID=UPI0036DDF5F4